MTDELLRWQTEALLALEAERRGIAVLVRPELVVEIALDGVQASKRYPGGVALRFARVKRYRPDKAAVEADTIDDLRALLHGGARALGSPRATERRGHGRWKGRRQPRNGPGGSRARHDRVPRRRPARPSAGRPVTMFLTKDAVRLALPGVAAGVACEGCPPIERLFEQYAAAGGELLVCPICFNARGLDEADLVANARIGGATPLWDWIGDEPATVFSY